MVEARDFKFGVHIVCKTCKPKNAEVGQEGRKLRHVTYFYNFGTHSISPMVEPRDFKFGVPIDRQASKPKNAK